MVYFALEIKANVTVIKLLEYPIPPLLLLLLNSPPHKNPFVSLGGKREEKQELVMRIPSPK